MKKLILTYIILGMGCFATAQESNYDNVMENLAKEVASRVRSNNKVQVAVWYFTDNKGLRSELGDYVARDFSIHFTNASEGLVVLDRDHFNRQLVEEHNLNDNGFIDPSTAKQIGMMAAADAVITGTVDTGLHYLRIRIKIIDTQTGLQFAAALKNVPPDENIKVILEKEKIDTPIDRSNRKRVNRSEKENDPRSTNTKCESLNLGDYCFKNTSNIPYLIDIRSNDNNIRIRRSITVQAQSDTCLTDLPVGAYTYSMYKNNLRVLMGNIDGGFRVERCKSLSYVIR